MYIQKILVKIKLLFFYLQARVESERWYVPKLQVMVWNEIQSELWEESQIHNKNRDRTKLWFFQIFADSLDRHKVIIFSILNGQVVVSCQPLDWESCLFFTKVPSAKIGKKSFLKKVPTAKHSNEETIDFFLFCKLKFQFNFKGPSIDCVSIILNFSDPPTAQIQYW